MNQEPPSGYRSGHIPLNAWTGFRCPMPLAGSSGRGNAGHEGCEVERGRLQRMLQKSRSREDALKDEVKRMKKTAANTEKPPPRPSPAGGEAITTPKTASPALASPVPSSQGKGLEGAVCGASGTPGSLAPVAPATPANVRASLFISLDHAFHIPAPQPSPSAQALQEQLQKTMFPCKACNRWFPSSYAVSVHVVNVHLKNERNKK